MQITLMEKQNSVWKACCIEDACNHYGAVYEGCNVVSIEMSTDSSTKFQSGTKTVLSFASLHDNIA